MNEPLTDQPAPSQAAPVGGLLKLFLRPIWVVLLIECALILFGSAAATWDTRGVRAARAELAKMQTGSIFGSNHEDQLADEKRAYRCFVMLQSSPDGKSTIRTSEWRECIMNAAPLTKTLAGGLVTAATAMPWIKEHPQDADFKAAILMALEAARTDLGHSQPWFLALQRESFAVRDSLVYRAMEPTMWGGGYTFEKMAERISMFEFQVRAPELYAKQIDWLDKAGQITTNAASEQTQAVATR